LNQPAFEAFLGGVLFDDVEDEDNPGVVNLHEEFIWVDVVEALKVWGPNNAIFRNPRRRCGIL